MAVARNAVKRASPVEPAPPQAARQPRRSLTLELESAPGHLIRRAQQAHTAMWGAELDGHLTSPQYALVSALRTAPDLDQRSAGRTASLDKSTTADVIARLERNGWVRRTRDPADSRRKRLLLTTAALAALNDITPRVQAVQLRLLDHLAKNERDEFVRLMGRVAYLGAPPTADDDPTVVALSTAPGHLLRRSEQVHGMLWNRHVGAEITPSQYALLCALAMRDELDQATAGVLASLDKSSVAEVVSRLRRRGWVSTEPDLEDRRRKLLRLAAPAAAMLETVTPAVAQVQEELLTPLTQRERSRLIAQLRRIAYAPTVSDD